MKDMCIHQRKLALVGIIPYEILCCVFFFVRSCSQFLYVCRRKPRESLITFMRTCLAIFLFPGSRSSCGCNKHRESGTARNVSLKFANAFTDEVTPVTNVPKWSLCEYVIVHTNLLPCPVILWLEMDRKLKWLPLNFGYHDVMRTSPIIVNFVWNGTCTNVSTHTKVPPNPVILLMTYM